MAGSRRDANDTLSARFLALEEPVVASVRITASTPTVTTGQPIVWTQVDIDTANAYNSGTGKFTCPSDGIYEVGCASMYTSTGSVYWAVYKNTTKYAMIAGATNQNAAPVTGGGTIRVSCVAGDQLFISPQNQNANVNFLANNYEASMHIRKVSN